MQLLKHPKVFYAQEGQSLPVRFAWVKKDGDVYKQQHYGVICKEFLTDAFIWHRRKALKNSIYGFSVENFSPEPYITLEHDPETINNFLSNHQLFAEIGWPIEIIMHEPGLVLVKLDEEWLKTSWRISLWNVLAKGACQQANQTLKEFGSVFPHKEGNHVAVAKMKFPGLYEKILGRLREIPVDKFDEVASDGIYDIHATAGFFSTFFYQPREYHKIAKAL